MRRVRAVRFDVFFAAVELWLQAALAACVCAQLQGDLESWVADLSAMAA